MRADSLFQQAEVGDETWVEPVLLRAEVAYSLFRIVDEPGEALAEAEAHAERALAMDPDHAEAHMLRGIARYTRWLLQLTHDETESDRLLDDARSDLEFAVNTDGTLARANNTLSHLFYQLPGEEVNVVLYARRAYEADAYLSAASDILLRLYNGYYDLEQPAQAGRWCDEGIRRFPDDLRFSVCQLWLMTTDLHAPDVAEAWRLAERIAAMVPDQESALSVGEARLLVGGVLARANLPDSARAVMLGARRDQTIDPGLNLVFYEAYMRVLLGDQDEAIDLLKRWLVANPEEDHGLEAGMNWWWRPLQSHPRFGEILSGGS